MPDIDIVIHPNDDEYFKCIKLHSEYDDNPFVVMTLVDSDEPHDEKSVLLDEKNLNEMIDSLIYIRSLNAN